MTANCAQMKKGQIYVCGDCGIELQVVKECTDADHTCGCSGEFNCCGDTLTLKE